MYETYLQSGLRNGRIVRWSERSFPLKMYIAPFRWYKSKDDASAYRYKAMVQRAIDAWSRVSNGKIRFQLVDDYLNSQVNLNWKRVDRKALGYCTTEPQGDTLFTADIEIGLSDGLMHAKYMDENEVYHTILHEVGHALGLGHSPNKADIMYTPHQYGVVNLSARDIASINWLYQLPIGASIKELNQKYNLNASNIDELISKISKTSTKSQFQNVHNSMASMGTQQRDLQKEQHKIAEINKYKLSLQNIQISHDLESYMKRVKMEQDKSK